MRCGRAGERHADDSTTRQCGGQGRVASRGVGLARTLTVLALALLVGCGIAVVGAPKAKAAFNPGGMDFWVDSSMGRIKTRVFRAGDGNTSRVLYALDGLRARNDLSGWEVDTDIPRIVSQDWNINVVMPVGGQSSFYTDWAANSNTNGQQRPYSWETFLTHDLRDALADQLGFSPTGNAVMGLSMGGSAALTLAAYHPDQFKYAGSQSGYLNLSGPGMREALRMALLDAGGFNIDAMWGPPWDPRWVRNDPTNEIDLLRANGTRLWVSAGSGLPGPLDKINTPVDAFHLVNAQVLETVALGNSRSFQGRWDAGGPGNATFDFPTVGVHAWDLWSDEVIRMLPDLSANI